MILYEIHESTLPGNNKLTISTLLKNSGIFKVFEEMKFYVKTGKVFIRGRDVDINKTGQQVKVRDDMVIKVKGKGQFRIRILGEDLAKKREQDRVNREIESMNMNL